MDVIKLLSNETINKIAAGEVVERPLNVVKELVENSIDALATAITVEIKGGGIELIRVTDNGKGIPFEQCENAFLRHATSKITSIDDLDRLFSLGFRGEALSSVSAVSKVEMITKTKDSMLGTRVCVEGGKLMEKSEVGAPDGTTMIIRSLFYNTPARKKFLKTPATEGSLIQDMMEKFALSNPQIAIQFILNGKTKISTSGNGSLKDVIYHIFGKDIYNSLLPVDYEELGIKVTGFTAKPEFSYQARNGELYFINGRYIKSKIINTAIEEVYRKYLMQHRFPFCVLCFNVSPDTIDVNVHPQKLEVKFSDNSLMVDSVINALNQAFERKTLIPTVSVPEEKDNNMPKEQSQITLAEIPDEIETDKADYNFKQEIFNSITESNEDFDEIKTEIKSVNNERAPEPFEIKRSSSIIYESAPEIKQESLFEAGILSKESEDEYHIIGQVFDTYWMIELNDDLYIVDQHAAHEKVNYEKFVSIYESGAEGAFSQSVVPPKVIHLSGKELNVLLENIEVFNKLGFEIEDFGMGSIVIRSIPLNLYGIDEDEMFSRLLDELLEKEGVFTPTFICEKLASLSCKAAIKGNQRIGALEMEGLMKQLMKLDNPYNCPHGRPVFIKMTKTDLEKRFKRIV